MELKIILFAALFSLLQPWQLLFALGISIPILIHLWNRHNHHPMDWAATHYLMLAMQKASKTISMQHLLLLLLRVLIVLILAFALSAPFSKSGISLMRTDAAKSTLHLIVIDDSFSMQTIDDENSRFERAKKIAISIVNTANPTDGFLLYSANSRLLTHIAEPIAEKSILTSEIELLTPSSDVLNVAAVCTSILALDSLNDATLFDTKQLHFISDYSPTDWVVNSELAGEERNNEDPKPNQISAALVQLATVANLTHHSVATEPISNNFITQISLSKASPQINKPIQISVDVANFRSTGLKTQFDQTVFVELLVNHKVIGSKNLVIKPNSTSSATFETQFARIGDNPIEARIGVDVLTADNRRFDIVDVSEKQEILFVESIRRSSRFLQFALEPNDIRQSDFRFTVVDSKGLIEEDFSKYQIVFVDNVRAIDASDVLRLRRYMSDGGSVAIFLGDQVDRSSYNQNWRMESNDLPKLPIELIGIANVDNYQIVTLDYLSPLLLPFRGNEDSGLKEMPIWSYFKVRIDEPNTTRTDLALQNGDPLLLTCRLGKGQCILFTSSSSSLSKNTNAEKTAWNANEAWPSFPPLIQEIYQSAIVNNGRDLDFVGDVLVGNFENNELVTELSIKDFDGLDVGIQWSQRDGIVQWKSDPIEQAGVITLESKSKSGQQANTFSVNVNNTESKLDTLPDTAPIFIHDDPEPSTDVWNRFQIYQVLLVVLAAALVGESLLSRRFGRER